MIFIFLSWIYITIVAFCIGNSFHHLLKSAFKIENTTREHFSIICISGILVIAFICTLLCLFIPLGLISNLLILLLALIGVIINRKNFKQEVGFYLAALRKTPLPLAFLFLAFLFIIGYISYLPSSHHDDGLYYSTSIKWLQEFGTVKGLTLVNPRIGFNSAWLILQANFGFQFLHAGLFNDLNGLIYLFFFIYFLQAVYRLYKGDQSLSNLLQSLFFLPVMILHTSAASDFLVYNSNMISSPSADLTTCLLISLVFILFLKSGEEQSNGIRLNELLIVFYSFSLISIKLSAAPILLFPAFLFIKFIRAGEIRQELILFLCFSGLLVPWLIRNILLSGWLIYPFTGLDLFHFDWKAPYQLARYYEYSTSVYPKDEALILQQPHAVALREWIYPWFNRQAYIHRVFFLLAMISTGVFFLIGIGQLLRRNFLFFKKQIYPVVFILISVSGILFWLVKGPDFRFGFGFIGIYGCFSLSLFFRFFLEYRTRLLAPWIISFSLFAVVIYTLRFKLAVVNSVIKRPLPLRQPDEIKTEMMNNGQSINLVEHDDSWNGPLPIANKNDYYYLRPVLRGKSIKDGFRQLQ
jgi:hypothetical protein